MKTTIQRTIAIGCVALITALLPASSWATAQDAATAEALFQDARGLMDSGNFKEACPKLEESRKLDPAMGTLLYLGECYENLGKTASAWAVFQTAADQLAREAPRSARAKQAAARVKALAAKLLKLTVVVGQEARVPGLEIRRDGAEIGEATWGVAMPIDPGEYTITARAPGKQQWVQKLTVAPGAKVTTVNIERLLDEPKTAPRAHPTSTASRSSAKPKAASGNSTAPPAQVDQGAHSQPGKTQRVLAYTATGVGVAGIITGTVLGFEGKSKQDSAHCNGDGGCSTTEGFNLQNSAHNYGTAANIAFGIGAAGLVTGAILFFTAPRSPSHSSTVGVWDPVSKRPRLSALPRISIAPVIAERSSSLLVSGSF